MDFSTWDSNLHNFCPKICKSRRFHGFHLSRNTSDSKNGESKTGGKKRNWWGSHLRMSWGDVDFLSLRPFRKSPVELVLWEAIFEVVAPSDVEDPRRPCGRHGHGALCHLGLKKNRFCTWKMVEFRSRWFQALGGSVVYGYLLPVIPDFRSSFFLGDAIAIRWLRLIWFLVLQRMRVRQRVTACVQSISRSNSSTRSRLPVFGWR